MGNCLPQLFSWIFSIVFPMTFLKLMETRIEHFPWFSCGNLKKKKTMGNMRMTMANLWENCKKIVGKAIGKLFFHGN